MKIYNQYQYSYPHKNEYYSIEKADIIAKLNTLQEGDLYVHLPFCSSKCGYCNLFSLVPKAGLVEGYLDAIKRQYSQMRELCSPMINSFILGGGTPSILSIAQLDELFSSIKIHPLHHYSVIELSPNETTLEKVRYLKEVGFNRVSIGVQSLEDSELVALNRKHTSDICVQALEFISNANFEDFNIDIIYGIKGQTRDSLRRTLEGVVSFAPTEIFIYPLYIRENTWLHSRFELDETHTQELYLYLREYLNERGYHQTSMRRFTRKEINSTVSCGFEKSIALGCGGRSYIDNLHFCEEYSSKPSGVYSTLERFAQKTDFFTDLVGYNLTDLDMKKRYVIKNLLHINGIIKSDYTDKFGSDVMELACFNERRFSEYINYEEDIITLKNFACSDFIIDLIW